MAKIICTQDEYDKLSTVLKDSPQFLSDVPIIYDIIKEASVDPEYHVKDSDAYRLISDKPAYQINTRVINIKEIVDNMLNYLGLTIQGEQIYKPRGRKRYEVYDVSINQARSIKRWVNKLMNPHDLYCDMEYDKSTRCATYDIVS